MQRTTTPTQAHTARAILRRMAWLGLGLFATAFAVFEVHIAIDRGVGFGLGLRGPQGFQRG